MSVPPVPQDVPEARPGGRSLRGFLNALRDAVNGGGGGNTTATYVTQADESAVLPNSRQLAAGTGITLTDGGAGSTLTIAASGGSGTVTNIATTAPITGGPITTTGTIGVSDLVGDSGSGGTRGTVPAPAAGDAAAGKFLKADATWVNPSSGLPATLSPSWANARIRTWHWTAGATTPQVINSIAPTPVGAPSASPVNPAGAGYYDQRNYERYISAATAGTGTGFTGMSIFWRGSAAGLGGFYIQAEFAVAAAFGAQPRIFVGLNGVATVNGAVEPSTMVNCVFFGADSTDTNLQLMQNAGSGTCTKLDLGSGFAIAAKTIFNVYLRADPNDSKISYYATATTNAGVVNTVSGSINTNLPTSGTFMTAQMYMAPATNAAIQLVWYRLYTETPGY